MSENGMVMRIHRSGGEIVVAACDAELLGRELKIGSGKHVVSASFYGSSLVTSELLIQHLSQATIANLLGKRVVDHALRAGLVEKNATRLLDGIPHAEFVRF